MTTTSLFVAALADHLSLLAGRSSQQSQCQVTLSQLEMFLFNDLVGVDRLRRTEPTSDETSFYPFLRLLPSARDRKPFLAATLGLRRGLAVVGKYEYTQMTVVTVVTGDW